MGGNRFFILHRALRVDIGYTKAKHSQLHRLPGILILLHNAVSVEIIEIISEGALHRKWR